MYKNLVFYLGLVVIKGPMGICTNGPIKARLMHTTSEKKNLILGHFGYTRNHSLFPSPNTLRTILLRLAVVWGFRSRLITLSRIYLSAV